MITIEKVDQVVERTGVSYEEARDALNACEGDVIDAIIYLEKSQPSFTESINIKSRDLLETLKDFLKKGNVTKVIVERDGEVVLNLPVTVGAIGLVLAPVVSILGIGTAIWAKFTVKIIKEDGEEIDVNKATEEKVAQMKEIVDEKILRKNKVKEDIEDAVEEVVEKVKETAEDIGEEIK
ncbi:MAG: DUF4342 domain-containing protein [Peptostreptococcaceae bacterium]|nr:DUF4342 domain-containing protein [Peptostreptococcaceae bacterium]